MPCRCSTRGPPCRLQKVMHKCSFFIVSDALSVLSWLHCGLVPFQFFIEAGRVPSREFVFIGSRSIFAPRRLRQDARRDPCDLDRLTFRSGHIASSHSPGEVLGISRDLLTRFRFRRSRGHRNMGMSSFLIERRVSAILCSTMTSPRIYRPAARGPKILSPIVAKLCTPSSPKYRTRTPCRRRLARRGPRCREVACDWEGDSLNCCLTTSRRGVLPDDAIFRQSSPPFRGAHCAHLLRGHDSGSSRWLPGTFGFDTCRSASFLPLTAHIRPTPSDWTFKAPTSSLCVFGRWVSRARVASDIDFLA